MKIFLACMMLYGAIHIESAKAGSMFDNQQTCTTSCQRIGNQLFCTQQCY